MNANLHQVRQGDTLLIDACRRQDWKAARWFVEHGHDVNEVSEIDGRNALDVCVAQPTWGHQVMANTLRSYGARETVRGDEKNEKNETLDSLTHLETMSDDEVLQAVDAGRIDRDACDARGDNWLMAAYRLGRWRLARELLKRGFEMKEDE